MDSKTDLRILKYKNYTKEHPDKPYGYYCLGKIYIQNNEYRRAESCFLNSLSLDNTYTLAKIGIVHTLVYRKKFIKAIHYYNKHKNQINTKQIFTCKLVRGISLCWEKRTINLTSQHIWEIIWFKYTLKALNNLLNKNNRDLTVNLILCMLYLSIGNKTEKTLMLYKNCVNIDSLTDSLRWELVKTLSQDNPEIFDNLYIAGKFSKIPSPNCPNEYADRILGVFLSQKQYQKARTAFNSIDDPGKTFSRLNMWKYVSLCMEKSSYDTTMYECCKALIKSGWIDGVLVKAFKELNRLNIAHISKQEEKIFQLFGYLY